MPSPRHWALPLPVGKRSLSRVAGVKHRSSTAEKAFDCRYQTIACNQYPLYSHLSYNNMRAILLQMISLLKLAWSLRDSKIQDAGNCHMPTKGPHAHHYAPYIRKEEWLGFHWADSECSIDEYSKLVKTTCPAWFVFDICTPWRIVPSSSKCVHVGHYTVSTWNAAILMEIRSVQRKRCQTHARSQRLPTETSCLQMCKHNGTVFNCKRHQIVFWCSSNRGTLDQFTLDTVNSTRGLK